MSSHPTSSHASRPAGGSLRRLLHQASARVVAALGRQATPLNPAIAPIRGRVLHPAAALPNADRQFLDRAYATADAYFAIQANRGSRDTAREVRAYQIFDTGRHVLAHGVREATASGELLSEPALELLEQARPGTLLRLLLQHDPMVFRPVWPTEPSPESTGPSTSVAAVVLRRFPVEATQVILADPDLAATPATWLAKDPTLLSRALEQRALSADAVFAAVMANPALAAMPDPWHGTIAHKVTAELVAARLQECEAAAERATRGATRRESVEGEDRPVPLPPFPVVPPYYGNTQGLTPLGAALAGWSFYARLLPLLEAYPQLLDEPATLDEVRTDDEVVAATAAAPQQERRLVLSPLAPYMTVRDLLTAELQRAQIHPHPHEEAERGRALMARFLDRHPAAGRPADPLTRPKGRDRLREVNPLLARLLDATDHVQPEVLEPTPRRAPASTPVPAATSNPPASRPGPQR